MPSWFIMYNDNSTYSDTISDISLMLYSFKNTFGSVVVCYLVYTNSDSQKFVTFNWHSYTRGYLILHCCLCWTFSRFPWIFFKNLIICSSIVLRISWSDTLAILTDGVISLGMHYLQSVSRNNYSDRLIFCLQQQSHHCVRTKSDKFLVRCHQYHM